MFRFCRKKSIALMLTVCFLLTMVAPGFAADQETTPDSCTVGVAVVDAQGNLVYGSKNVTVQESGSFGLTALGALLGAVDEAEIPYEIEEYSWGHMLKSINGVANDPVTYDGWLFAVNDKSLEIGADAFEIKEGDRIVCYYGAFGDELPKWNSLQIPDSTESPVSVAIVGKDGELLFTPGEITVQKSGKWGLTALGALDATGIEHEVTDSDYGPYISSINGQVPEDMAGWMYTVNDQSQLVGVGDYILNEGDCIIFYYSSNWEDPAPKWADLTQQTPPNPGPKPDPKPESEIKVELQKALAEVVAYYQNNKTTLRSWDEVVALRSAGVDLTDGSWKLPDWNIDGLDEESYATDYAGTIMGMMAAGQDPTTANGRNLVQELVNRQKSDGSFGDWLNETIWSMIALDTVKAEYDVAEAVAYLRSQQLKDGGFALFGTDGDPDTTGMALIALASHRNIEGVPAVITDAIECLKDLQQESGGFASWGEESAESAAAVIRGLVACGVDPYSMAKSGKTVVAALFAYQLEDKSFCHVKDGKSNPMATIQALTAIGDMVNGNVFKRIRDSYTPGQLDSKSESDQKTTLPKTGGNNSPLFFVGTALLFAGTYMVRRKQPTPFERK